MDQGRIVQVGTYEGIYSTPTNIFTAEFLNLEYETRAINLCPGEVVSPRFAGKIVGFRPEDVVLSTGEQGQLRSRVIDSIAYPLRKLVVLTVELDAGEIQLYAEEQLPEGAEVQLKINRLHVFNQENGKRIETVLIKD
jgi:ABC-type sugar transport system ATPase subunit